MNIDILAKEVHELAIKQGWWDAKEDNTDLVAEKIACIHGELSEFWEAYRNGALNKPCDKADNMMKHGIEVLTSAEEELADVFIRTMDLCARLGINIEKSILIKHEYNKTRDFRHGNKLA